MRSEQFIEFMEDMISKNKDNFISNMNSLSIIDKKPHEWMDLFTNWCELGSEDAARLYYGKFYE